ncbi:hypothetical protein P43SY_009848 [Pythium insidiosum]|uniref:Uncharacterized protein n=1 Tax=Pythium insidiosum TaxID=114742 RepID=A0AAD5MEA9_PYTIN|nr:hypothetical protein P43SY_009848 [Pythium insidiosum]
MVAIAAGSARASRMYSAHHVAVPSSPLTVAKASSDGDLYRFVCALSVACRKDHNVLRDGQLVDALERRAKEILRARSKLRDAVALSSSTVSKPHSGLQAPSVFAHSKRRKLPHETTAKMEQLAARYAMPRFFQSTKGSAASSPALGPQQKHTGSSPSLVPSAVRISKIEPRRAAPPSPSLSSPSVSPLNASSCRATRASSPTSDFAASMASTVSSASMPHFEMSDMDDMDISATEVEDQCQSRLSFHSDDAEAKADRLQAHVDSLLVENGKVLAENARLQELSAMSSCELEQHTQSKAALAAELQARTHQLALLERELNEMRQRASAQENCRRQAEVAFQAELDAKSDEVAELHEEVARKDGEIDRLSRRIEEISALVATKMKEEDEKLDDDVIASLRESNLFMDVEMKKMKATLLEKDREICKLYMHLSTKKKLIEEITKKFVQHMESASASTNNQSPDSTTAPSLANVPVENVRFDLDMFLFKNVVDKQRRMDEITAALGVMDREVESLEARVAAKERENTQLRENQDVLTRSLQTANAQVCRIQAANAQLEAVLQDKEARLESLQATIDQNKRHIESLNDLVAEHQLQIDAFISTHVPSAPSDSATGRMTDAELVSAEEWGFSGELSECDADSDVDSNRASYCASDMPEEERILHELSITTRR